MEIHKNIFTDFLKSYNPPSGLAGNGDTITTEIAEGCTDLDGPSEELSQNRALLESLMSKEFGPSASKKPTDNEESSDSIIEEKEYDQKGEPANDPVTEVETSVVEEGQEEV